MAAINDLISQIQDETLRNRIQEEVSKMAKQKKFGLVFEEHLPENVIAYRLNGKAAGDIWSEIFVAFNGNNSLQEISIPDGNWTIVCLDGKIDEAGISSISGNKINLPRSSAVILKR